MVSLRTDHDDCYCRDYPPQQRPCYQCRKHEAKRKARLVHEVRREEEYSILKKDPPRQFKFCSPDWAFWNPENRKYINPEMLDARRAVRCGCGEVLTNFGLPEAAWQNFMIHKHGPEWNEAKAFDDVWYECFPEDRTRDVLTFMDMLPVILFILFLVGVSIAAVWG